MLGRTCRRSLVALVVGGALAALTPAPASAASCTGKTARGMYLAPAVCRIPLPTCAKPVCWYVYKVFGEARRSAKPGGNALRNPADFRMDWVVYSKRDVPYTVSNVSCRAPFGGSCSTQFHDYQGVSRGSTPTVICSGRTLGTAELRVGCEVLPINL